MHQYCCLFMITIHSFPHSAGRVYDGARGVFDNTHLDYSDSRRMKTNLEKGNAQTAADAEAASDLSNKENRCSSGGLDKSSNLHTCD